MNKTVNINLASTFFHIDEDAFAKLTRYLDAIRSSFSDPKGQDEIIKDIEARIAELFSEKTTSASQVITLKELDQVIAVMGQPEDYIIDEEIFEDTPSNEQKRNQSKKYHKQLFRDIDNKFVAGVSAGLGHYFSIDALWIRLFWILMVLIGFGSPILIYILLWILIPEAITTADKLKMTQEPINISNIEKKIKSELNKASDKIKEVDYDKHVDTAKKGASDFFSTVSKIFVGIFKVFRKFFGVLLIIISLSTLIGLIVGLFTAGTFGLVWGNHELIDYVTVANIGETPIWLISLLTLFTVGIPFFVLFILGLKLLITNLKSIGTPAKIILAAIWFLSIIALGIIGLRQATEQAYDGEEIIEHVLPVKAGDTIRLTMNVKNDFEHRASKDTGFEIKLNDNDEKVIYSKEVRLIVRSTNDSVGSMYIEKRAEGKSFIDAKNRAKDIDYSYRFNNNTIELDGFFTASIDDKYRDQEIEIIIYLPKESILWADKNTYSYHRNSSRYNDILNNGDEEHYLIINEDKTQCLDCPDSDIDFEYNSSNNKWELDVKENFKEIDKESKTKSHIIIDKNGVDININEDSETVKVQIGN
jgi:phage shock protein PspC (stress-responsive transcriptional regulator)